MRIWSLYPKYLDRQGLLARNIAGAESFTRGQYEIVSGGVEPWEKVE